MSSDAPYAHCVDCEAPLSAREAVKVPVHMDREDGGYDRVPMPACRRCRLKRHGHACEHCGTLHMTIEAAYHCCMGVSKAPDCPECGRRMEATAWGYDPVEGQTITCAECECCPVFWGRFTQFDYTDDEPCKHVDEAEVQPP